MDDESSQLIEEFKKQYASELNNGKPSSDKSNHLFERVLNEVFSGNPGKMDDLIDSIIEEYFPQDMDPSIIQKRAFLELANYVLDNKGSLEYLGYFFANRVRKDGYNIEEVPKILYDAVKKVVEESVSD